MLQTPTSTGLTPPSLTNVNGILPIASLSQMEASARQQAEQANNQPVIQNLAAHVRKIWNINWQAKQEVEERMLKSMRQRRGQYDPDVAAEIKAAGGTEIYMMLTANKCRAATSWLTDTLMGAGEDKPWTIRATPMPDIPPDIVQQLTQETYQEASALAQELGADAITPPLMRKIAQRVKARTLAKIKEATKLAVEEMERKMEDQLVEGGFIDALGEFCDDISTFPAAILRGPIIRKKPRLKWQAKATGGFDAVVKEELVKEWERVDPFMIYPSPNASSIDDGDLIHRHRLSRRELLEMKGVEGYSSESIDAVLEEYGKNGLHNWIQIDTQKAEVEGKMAYYAQQNSEGLIDALQLWGSVQGSMLIEWGMDASKVPEPTKEYDCEVWLIGNWVIKATLNYDPLGRKNYYKASYEEIPGVFWGNAPPDLVRDCQAVCNAAARALVNNMGIASGPQVNVNVDRLPKGEDITEMYPWKIWQTKSDPFGSTAPAIDFFQPSLLAGELMGIYERFSTLADEYSSIPKYISGDATPGGAGRTASGLSMLMTNAGKGIKQVVANIDKNITTKVLERLYYHNMRYETDPALKGDVQIVARGARGLVVKESIQQRRNEFMQIVLNSPIVNQMVGVNGLAALLREGAKNLDMDVEDLIPSEEELKIMQANQLAAAQQGGAQGPNTMSQPNQTLQDGAPVTDNFSPMRQA
jgi:hypothetical protein